MKRILLCSIVLLICLPAFAQQPDVNRFTLFTGFDYMVSPARNLTERGFESDFGVTLRPWLALGADFSAIGDGIISGAGTINGGETVYAPTLIAAAGHGLPVPPPSAINVPFSSQTFTFAAGPQFYLRKWKKVTFFARPGLGLIHERANINLPPQLGVLLGALGKPVPSAHLTDTTYFVGAGGGFDLNLSRGVGFRFATDWVNTHLFSNLLTNRQNYVRLSMGPTFRWGTLEAR
jgi:hypothetical protein